MAWYWLLDPVDPGAAEPVGEAEEFWLRFGGCSPLNGEGDATPSLCWLCWSWLPVLICLGGLPHRSLPKLTLNFLYSSRPRTASIALMAFAMLVKFTNAQLFSRSVLTSSISPYSEKSCLRLSSVHDSSKFPM